MSAASGSGGPGPGPGHAAPQGPGTGTSSPRKFSEKIALHTQRQAEETAAFQEVMMDITSTRLQAQKLRMARVQGSYYGSLPNVNQIGRNPQDFQGSFPSSVECSRSTRHHGLVERVQRERRFASPVRPYRNRQTVDSSPYNSAYLSPPPDPSWRRNWSGNFPGDKSQLYRLPATALNRTNSDSALHTSVMNPSGDPFITAGPTMVAHGNRVTGQSDGEGRRMFPYPVPPIEENVLDEGKLLKPWDTKKLPLMSSRPKSCEVPGINIFTSPEQPVAPPLTLPSNLTTGGSLPDLSSLHFPSPLPTPLDRDEHPADLRYQGPNPLSGGSSTGNLASTLTQLGINHQANQAAFHHTHNTGLLASLQCTLSNPSLPSSLSNPNIQSSLSSMSSSSFSSSSSSNHNNSLSSLSSASLHSSLGSSSAPSLSSSLSNSSLHSVTNNNNNNGGGGGLGGGGGGSYSNSSISSAASSSSPRRRAQLSPLILPMGGGGGGGASENRRLHSKQFSPTISPTLSSITQGVPLDTSKLPLDQRLPPYPLSQSHQHTHTHTHANTHSLTHTQHANTHSHTHPQHANTHTQHANTHSHTHTQTHTQPHMHTHTHTQPQMHTHTHTQPQTHTHTHTQPQTHTHTHTQPQTGQQRHHQQLHLQNLRNTQNHQNMPQHFGTHHQQLCPPQHQLSNSPLIKEERAMEQQTSSQCGALSISHSLATDLYTDALFNSLLDDPYLSLQLTGKATQQFSDQSDCLSLKTQFPSNTHQGTHNIHNTQHNTHNTHNIHNTHSTLGSLQETGEQQNYGSLDPRHNVPNIILTGDSPPGLSKEIASALSHVPGFEMDPFSLDDPLSLGMLDGELMLADPAVEDSFRSDRLK